MTIEKTESSPATGQYGAAAARRWKRYSIQTRLKIIAVRNKVKIMAFGQSDNLSEGGMGFYCPQAFQINEQIEIELELPATSKSAVKLSGIVRTFVNEVYGVEFYNMGTRQLEEIARACKALAKYQG